MTRELPQTLTGEEVQLLRGAPNLACPSGLRDRCMIELMLRCGLRVTETCELHLRDVDWRASEIRIRSEIAKGGREAVVYLDEPTRALLERWKAVRRGHAKGSPWLFVCVRRAELGRPLTRRGVYKMVRRRGVKAGIGRPIWPHMLRHTFATELLGERFNLEEVRKAMRHSDLRTTQIYLEVRDVDLAAKLRQRAQG